jgi:hypothetical protein
MAGGLGLDFETWESSNFSANLYYSSKVALGPPICLERLPDAKTCKNKPNNAQKRPICVGFHIFIHDTFGHSAVFHPPAIGRSCSIALDASVCRCMWQRFSSSCRCPELHEFRLCTELQVAQVGGSSEVVAGRAPKVFQNLL